MSNIKTYWNKNKSKLGAFIDLVTFAVFWFGLINFIFIALTAYNTTLKTWVLGVIPGFNLGWFLVLLLLVIAIVFTLEYFFLYPARQRFRNEWEYKQGSPIQDDLKKVQKDIQKIKKHLGVEDD